MKWTLVILGLILCGKIQSQQSVLPSYNNAPYLYSSIDSILANTYIDQSTLLTASTIELVTETKRAFSVVVIKNGTGKEYPLVIPDSNHRIQLEEIDSYDVNGDGVYDLIVTLNHLQGHSVGDATFQETVISKYILDTVHADLLLKDTSYIERISTLLLGESPDPVSQTSTCSCPIHVFEGKIVFMPCTGNGCEKPNRSHEEEYLWNGNVFILKEN